MKRVKEIFGLVAEAIVLSIGLALGVGLLILGWWKLFEILGLAV
jgi:hypothetical protein